jgi:hypothetical protein
LESNVSDHLKISNQLISKIVVGLIDSTEKCIENFQWLKQKNSTNQKDDEVLVQDNNKDPSSNIDSRNINTPPMSDINCHTTRESNVEDWLNNNNPEREEEAEFQSPSNASNIENTREPVIKMEKRVLNYRAIHQRGRNRIRGIRFIGQTNKSKSFYDCDICGYRSKGLIRHEAHKKNHVQPQKDYHYKCNKCNFSTSTRSVFLAHENGHVNMSFNTQHNSGVSQNSIHS